MHEKLFNLLVLLATTVEVSGRKQHFNNVSFISGVTSDEFTSSSTAHSNMILRLLLFAIAAYAGLKFTSAKLYPIEFRLPLEGKVPHPGDIWPKPLSMKSEQTRLTLDSSLAFESNLESCVVIKKALKRYHDLIFLDSRFKAAEGLKKLAKVNVEVTDTKANCEYPQSEEEEAYELDVAQSGASIKSATVWGALRGLETLSQIIYEDESYNLYVNLTQIKDAPRFHYRGLLMDTARHYIPVKTILQNLDAMAYNKLNTFHWHIVDDQSFPLVMRKDPKISEMGAYTPAHIYTEEDVTTIIEYARERGIRVVPELDTPGHTHGLARHKPDLLTPCWKDGKPDQPDYPNNSEREILNPMKNETFDFMIDMFKEFKARFPDKFIHLGMDEVNYSCWLSSPEIKKFMEENGMTKVNDVEQYYVKRTIQNVRDIGYKYMLWQDPVDNGVVLANDSIVVVWKDTELDREMLPWQTYIRAVLDKKYKVILAACWYLNYIRYPYPGMDWEKYYQCDPHNFTGITDEDRKLIIGGQANIWAEFADGTNIVARLWPRASAVAERLWSPADQITNVDDARHRLDNQRCRMVRRGVPTSPILNGYCGAWEIQSDKPTAASAGS